jgi:hypothetical protein
VAALALGLALIWAPSPALAGKPEAVKPVPGGAKKTLASAGDELRKATDEYKKSLNALIEIHEASAKSAADVVAKRKALLEQGIVSRREVEDAERALAQAQAKIQEARNQIATSDALLAEAEAAEQAAAAAASRRRVTYAVIRGGGASGWALSEASKVSGFFAQRFGRALPVSAYGQTSTHDRLGYDHRNAVDVAVHPDSSEGQALIAYLRGQGIPFLAFRSAVPGVATGAHIHIGRPSSRL